jgi:hypothetical protein
MNMRITPSILLGMTSLLLALPLLAQSATKPATFKAAFTAEYTMQFKVPTYKSEAGKAEPQPAAPQTQTVTIPGEGNIIWAEPNFRVDFTNDMNQEAMRLLVNFDTGKATMLYPDTLNGYRTDLKAMDTHGYLPVARDFLSKRNEDFTPQGFSKKTLGAETINGAKTVHTQYARKDGVQADIWRAPSGDPVKFSAKTAKGKLVLTFTSFARGVKVDPKSFSVDKGYELKDVKEPPSEFTN